MHQTMISALKRRCLLALSFFLLFTGTPTLAFDAQQGEPVIIINPDAPTFPLLENTALENSVIGIYNSGVLGYVVNTHNGTALVRIGGTWDANDGVIGYVPESYLGYADAGIPVSASLPVAEVHPLDGGDAVLLRTEHGILDSGGGMLPAGAQVEVLAEMPDSFHVQFGEVVGFLPKDALRMVDKRAMFGYGIARDGFATGYIPKAYLGSMSEIPLYAYPDTDYRLDESIYFDETVSLINDLGEWAQVRTDNGSFGFVKSESLTKHLLADMRAAASEAYGAGSYTVGADLPPGLYTLDIPSGGSGGIEAIGQGHGAYHNYHADGYATFAMYLQAPMSVEITGQATLTPMDTDKLIAEDIGWEYSGNGRFFCGVQLRSHWVFMYEITLLPGESVGYVVTSSLSAETGQSKGGNRRYLTPGEVHYITMTQGEFVEFRNCVIVGKRGNG